MTIDFPNTRLEESTTGNPLFVTDIVNATQSIQAAMQSILGLKSTDFAIVSGLEYSAGYYSNGIVWLGDGFYYFNGTLTEGYYLTPNITNVENKTFADSVIRPTYSINYCVQSATPYGTNPVFSGYMNKYRINSMFLITNMLSVTNIVDNLITSDIYKPLSANQGVIIKSLLDNKLNLTGVYAWAKAASKPSYNFTEILNEPLKIQSNNGAGAGINVTIANLVNASTSGTYYITQDDVSYGVFAASLSLTGPTPIYTIKLNHNGGIQLTNIRQIYISVVLTSTNTGNSMTVNVIDDSGLVLSTTTCGANTSITETYKFTKIITDPAHHKWEVVSFQTGLTSWH